MIKVITPDIIIRLLKYFNIGDKYMNPVSFNRVSGRLRPGEVAYALVTEKPGTRPVLRIAGNESALIGKPVKAAIGACGIFDHSSPETNQIFLKEAPFTTHHLSIGRHRALVVRPIKQN